MTSLAGSVYCKAAGCWVWNNNNSNNNNNNNNNNSNKKILTYIYIYIIKSLYINKNMSFVHNIIHRKFYLNCLYFDCHLNFEIYLYVQSVAKYFQRDIEIISRWAFSFTNWLLLRRYLASIQNIQNFPITNETWFFIRQC